MIPVTPAASSTNMGELRAGVPLTVLKGFTDSAEVILGPLLRLETRVRVFPHVFAFPHVCDLF